MLGHMCLSEAKYTGYTHHASYYGIPVWVGGIEDEDEEFITVAKWYPLEYLITVVQFLEGIVQAFSYPDEERSYQYSIKYPI